MNSTESKLTRLLTLVNDLPRDRADEIVDEIYARLTEASASTDNSVYSLGNTSTVFCKKCGSSHIVKNGKDRRGHTRYLCRNCNCTFGDTAGSVVFGSHKSADVWKKYIALMIDGHTLARCAKECSITLRVAFIWRHKILNALAKGSFASHFNGILEMDEMYVRISYKGNHSKSKSFVMPRPAFKRGSDNHIPGNNAKAAVLCVVERNNGFSAMVPCRGTPNLTLLSRIFDDRISDESIVLTDGLHAYNQYFRNKEAEHIVLPSNDKKPSVCGPYHINNVNAFQRRFLINYNGVATKYLDNYLALFVWLENNRNYDRNGLMLNEMVRNGSYTPSRAISDRAPAPELAPVA